MFMLSKIITWDIYEIIPESSLVTGVKMRGRIRKFCLEAGRNVLVENVEDIDNRVRFAVPSGESASEIIEYIIGLAPDVKIVQVMKKVPNPVLSKLKINITERYK